MGFKGRSLASLLSWTTRREHVYEVPPLGKAALGQFRNGCKPDPRRPFWANGQWGETLIACNAKFATVE